ncbi:MAG: class C sortase [Peptococcus niger]
MSRKNKVIVGHILILIGIALPLYGFFGLTKGIILDDAAFQSFMKSGQVYTESLAQGIDRYNRELSDEASIVDPFATDEYDSNYSVKYDVMKNKDEVFAYLQIPKLGLEQPIYLDASDAHLAMGVAHVEGTDLPTVKPGTRSVIAGHRGYYQATMFMHLDQLEAGDPVYIRWPDRTLAYQVADKEVINSWETEKLNPVPGQTTLTLLTCEYAFLFRSERLLVNCTLYDNPETLSANTPKEPVAKRVTLVNALILLATALLMAALLWRLAKLIRALRQ